jgi:hypothetical protein
MVGKKATDDPQFKYAEKRGMWHKRYGYVSAFHNGSAWKSDDASFVDTSDATIVKDGLIKVLMCADYNNKGNIQNVFGQSTGQIDVGDDGTQPLFYLTDQVIKINFGTAAGSTVVDYGLFRITKVTAAQTLATVTGWDLSAGAAEGSTRTMYGVELEAT